jgi:hypothetical protein
MSSENRPINPLRVAQKMHGVRNFENFTLFEEFRKEPRLIEVLWALQFFSQPARPKPGHEGQFIGGYPGGLRAFTHDFINDSLDLIGTHKMRQLGAARYDHKSASTVYNEIPSHDRALGDAGDEWMFEAVLCNATERNGDPFFDEPVRPRRISDRAQSAIVRKANREAFLKLCIKSARESLADYLRNLCELPHVHFHRDTDADRWAEGQPPWFFADLGNALLRFIDRRKQATYRQIADTEISRLVGKWLGRAQATRRGVLISGNSRFGKTESVQAYCEANPGLARLIQTPSSNSESDLLRAVTKAFGMEVGPKQRGYQLREEIGYLIEQAALMLVFDEAQAIFPLSFGRNTPPTRLNWIRRNVLDCGVPAGFVCTPQSYESARRKYLRVTNFAIQQWDERLLQTVHLPGEVGHEDLLAIARIRFPALDQDYLEYLVNAVQMTERNFVSDISRIADLAGLNAEESGRTQPNLADIEAAIADALPAPKPTVDSVPILLQLKLRKNSAGAAHATRTRCVTSLAQTSSRLIQKHAHV